MPQNNINVNNKAEPFPYLYGTNRRAVEYAVDELKKGNN